MENPLTPSPTTFVSVTIAPAVRGLKLGLVHGFGLRIGPSPVAFREWCVAEAAELLKTGMAGGEKRREAIRKMLRAGGFKPAGRNKPAQEYLQRTLTIDGFPEILNAVDAINIVSLKSRLPISLLAAERFDGHARVRYGQPGEQFVFNRSGQALELDGLLCVCAGVDETSKPLGSPIKDSMFGKVTEADHTVLAVIYAPADDVPSDELRHWTEQLARTFQLGCPDVSTSENILEP